MFEENPDIIDEEAEKLAKKKKKALDMDDQEADEMRRLEFEKYKKESDIP